MQNISTVLFDWDGTLMDSASRGFTAFQHTFRDLGIEFDNDLYQKIYSPNWYVMYEALGLPAEKWPEADDLWLRHYGEKVPNLVEGARTIVLALCRKGYRLGVVSSGSCPRVRREVECAGLDYVFEAVICHEDTTNKKPHPEGLERAAGAMGTNLAGCCYIGDSPIDIEMGRNAGILTIGVPGGYPGSHKLAEANPDIYAESLYSLLRHL